MSYVKSLGVLLLLSTLIIQASDFAKASSDKSDIEQGISHASERDVMVSQLFDYLFGRQIPHEVVTVVKRKLGDSHNLQESLRRISDSSETSSQDDPDAPIKLMVAEAINEALEEIKLEATDAKLQLELKEKEVRKERYKFLIGVAGTITAGLGVVGTIIAYQETGC